MPSSDVGADYGAVRQVVLDWLDDNYHFGDAATLVGDDERSFLQNGVLDSLGFVKLILFLEERFRIAIDRKALSTENFDGLGKICRHVTSHRDFRGAA